MSYVYMKALEKKATKYDKGIRILTLGRLSRIKQLIIDNYLNPNDSILDIGMGTGTFVVACAKSGKNLSITGIDQSDSMLGVAQKNIKEANVQSSINLNHLTVAELDKSFENGAFDKITAILSFSEMYPAEQDFCLKQIHRLLKPNGEFILVDETKSHIWWKQILYFLVRIPLVFITFMMTSLSTNSLKRIYERMEKANFILLEEKGYLLDSLTLYRVKKRKK